MRLNRFSKVTIDKAGTIFGLCLILVCGLILAQITWRIDMSPVDRSAIVVGLTIYTALAPVFYRMKFRHLGEDPQAHACERCGYDLRATPARCPECGHEPNYARIDLPEKWS